MAHKTSRYTILLKEIDSFRETMEATTVRVPDGRKVAGIAHAVELSQANDRLVFQLVEFSRWFHAEFGRTVVGYPAGVTFAHSDSPDGPWTPIPPEEVKGTLTPIGGEGGGDAALLAAVDSAYKVTGYQVPAGAVIDLGAIPRQRWHAGEVIPVELLDHLEAAAKLVRLRTATTAETKPAPESVPPIYVQLAPFYETLTDLSTFPPITAPVRPILIDATALTGGMAADEYRPASWFAKGASKWLRKASSKNRVAKSVKKRIDNRTTVYCVADVDKWRPDLMPDRP